MVPSVPASQTPPTCSIAPLVWRGPALGLLRVDWARWEREGGGGGGRGSDANTEARCNNSCQPNTMNYKHPWVFAQEHTVNTLADNSNSFHSRLSQSSAVCVCVYVYRGGNEQHWISLSITLTFTGYH